MSHWPVIDGKSFKPPESLYDRIMEDIPLDAWLDILKENPILKQAVLKGFSGRGKKLSSALAQPEVRERLKRFYRSDTSAFQDLLEYWGDEMPHLVILLHMFDGLFILDYWAHLRNLFGPERFFATLCLCGDFEHAEFCNILQEEQDFWTRKADVQSLALFAPALAVVKDYAEEYPEVGKYLFDPEDEDDGD
jgi:hypothetical protein